MKRLIAGMLGGLLVMGGAAAQTDKKPASKPAAKPAAQAAPAAEVKDAATLEFEKFRAEMEDGNPAELFEMKGEEQWKAKRGPKNVSLAESCDLGLGVGVVKGAYVQTPRYFADADKVMDAERRIVWCMVEKQGFKEDDIAKQALRRFETTRPTSPISSPMSPTQSQDMKIAVPLKDPQVQGRLRDRQGNGRLPRRPLRLLLQYLPRRRRQAHPHAATAQHHHAEGRHQGPC